MRLCPLESCDKNCRRRSLTATHAVQVGAFGDRSPTPLLRQRLCKEHGAALRNPKSRLNRRCLLGVGGFAVTLLRSQACPAEEVCPGSRVWGAGCVRVRAHWPVYVRGEEDLLLLECQYCICWRNSAIRRAKGQRAITLPRRTRAISSLRGLASACRRRDTSVPGYPETTAHRFQSFAFPGRREPLGQPSHAGDPDDSTVLCGESIWTGESGLAWQQVGFIAFPLICRSVWVI